MRAGTLSYITTIERPTVSRDEYGAETLEWNEVSRTRANRVFRSGSRTLEDGRIVFDNVLSFEFRLHTPIRHNDVIVCEGIRYRVLSITPDPFRQQITVSAEEIHE